MACPGKLLELSVNKEECPNVHRATTLEKVVSQQLSLKESVKVLGVKSARSLGSFVGLSENDLQPMSLWKETWIKKVKSGNLGISLKMHPNKNESSPEDQIRETLSQLQRIETSINAENLHNHDEDLTLLEDIHFKKAFVQITALKDDHDLPAEEQSPNSHGPAVWTEHSQDPSSQDVTCVRACTTDSDIGRNLLSLLAGEPESESPFMSSTDISIPSMSANGEDVTEVVDGDRCKPADGARSELNDSEDQLQDDEKPCSLSLEEKSKINEPSATADLSQIHVEVERTLKGSKTSHDMFVYGKEALQHYRLFREIEKKKQVENLAKERGEIVKKLQWQLDTLNKLVEVGKQYFYNPKGQAAEEWYSLQRDVADKCNSQLPLEDQLGRLPVYWPYFTYFIIIVQIVTFIVVCSLGGVTAIGFEAQMEFQEDMKTFLGSETVHKLMVPNPWIGPGSSSFIGLGAFFAPCMREDYSLNLKLAQKNYSLEEPLGCCEIFLRNTAGTTTEKECDKLTNGAGLWKGETVCSQRISGNNSIEHNMKPCCVGIKGDCYMMSHHHCVFLEGIYHIRGSEHCSQVSCLSEICGLGGLELSAGRPWMALSPNQWWRLLLSLIYNQGVLQLICVCIGHLLLTRTIEPIAGWLRVAVIYVLAGIAGVMAGAVFSPYEPHFGTVGALFGMVGVALVEFMQSWRLVKTPRRELAKLLAIVIVSLVCGTLPFLSNFQLLFSMLTGMITSVIILPYVTFGYWNTRCRQLLVGVCVPLLCLITFLIMFVFYRVQTLQHCLSCQTFECIPYKDKFCLTGY